jgi:hypothetical protein
MEKTKLTIRVSRDLIEGAKRYASENDTTLTRLISEYLRQLATQSDPLANAPIVQRLSGTLSQDVSVDDYRKYLEEKYGIWITNTRRRAKGAKHEEILAAEVKPDAGWSTSNADDR